MFYGICAWELSVLILVVLVFIHCSSTLCVGLICFHGKSENFFIVYIHISLLFSSYTYIFKLKLFVFFSFPFYTGNFQLPNIIINHLRTMLSDFFKFFACVNEIGKIVAPCIAMTINVTIYIIENHSRFVMKLNYKIKRIRV